jgi:hypothetical protein
MRHSALEPARNAVQARSAKASARTAAWAAPSGNRTIGGRQKIDDVYYYTLEQ